ncbi:MAG: hypothetical protein GC193_05550 [Cryomorphaceae bacterium]|nr:hypothetical protein [Cryomorphaceae bacterium]
MTLKDFLQQFPDEESCILYIRRKREKQGITCRKCGCKSHSWYKTRSMWQCKNCRYRTSLKVGTVMEDSNLPLKTWMHALYLMTHTKKSYSACEMQRILGHSRYETIWYLMQRIRQFISENNRKLFTSGIFDHRENLKNRIQIRRKKTCCKKFEPTIFIHPESYLSSQVRGISDQMQLVLASEPTFHESNKPKNYKSISEHFQSQYNLKFSEPQSRQKALPKWIQNILFNVNCVIKGVHHFVQHKYLQLYLDEFSFKYNHRNDPDFFNHFIDIVFKPFWYNSE